VYFTTTPVRETFRMTCLMFTSFKFRGRVTTLETYSRIGLLQSYGNLQSYWTSTKLWNLTVVLDYCEAMEPYSLIGLQRSYENIQSYSSSPASISVVGHLQQVQQFESPVHFWRLGGPLGTRMGVLLLTNHCLLKIELNRNMVGQYDCKFSKFYGSSIRL
jgi:hypothetical protein